MNEFGLYLHVPFCRQKCFYCDFASYAGAEHLFTAYTAALCQQIAEQGGLLCKPAVDTIYIGGGTPSLLPVQLLTQIMTALDRSFSIQREAEISMEANPGTVTKNQLTVLKAAGINRLSFGVQSFNDSLLARLGRIHQTADTLAALDYAYRAGFTNISIDLMYGLPGQRAEGFARELEQAAALETAHLSVYGLKLEAGTPFCSAYDQGLLALPDEIAEEAMYDLMVEVLPGQGLRRYEISNFARPGRECRHNLKYWHYQPYLGLGAAAHSFVNGERTSAVPAIEEYIRAIKAGSSPVIMREKLTRAQAIAEYIFLALRTTQGLKAADFTRQFHLDFFIHFAHTFNELRQQKLLATNGRRVWLTDKGMKFSNLVFAAFIDDH
ncbi:radical SAM family heme chaperone HemW [Sporomusa termitida]|uniref:Heme chaperone HemW n=1 Tax=Sporomusa termitida TaxID=2377 RepID=A0A517DUC1_9FIRM|nr:radical SAM family heme chaperone HemW [Sporomusa termitida]QDR80954.1 Oxygen-independent coproporphyrinogen-III oxidase-like protein YqeR [Sporomusa termitida]